LGARAHIVREVDRAVGEGLSRQRDLERVGAPWRGSQSARSRALAGAGPAARRSGENVSGDSRREPTEHRGSPATRIRGARSSQIVEEFAPARIAATAQSRTSADVVCCARASGAEASARPVCTGAQAGVGKRKQSTHRRGVAHRAWSSERGPPDACERRRKASAEGCAANNASKSALGCRHALQSRRNDDTGRTGRERAAEERTRASAGGRGSSVALA